MNGLRHVCLVLCAIVRYLAIYLSQLHFLPSTGTKVERDWKYNPRHSLTEATIEPLKAPGPLQAEHQFSLSVHEAIWLGNKPISTSFLFNSQQKNPIRETTFTINLILRHKWNICYDFTHCGPIYNIQKSIQEAGDSWGIILHSL